MHMLYIVVIESESPIGPIRPDISNTQNLSLAQNQIKKNEIANRFDKMK